MMMPVSRVELQQYNVGLTVDSLERLRAAAVREDRSVAGCIRLAVEEWLARREQ